LWGTSNGIFNLDLPNNARELRHFLGMVQYHWDIRAKCSEMLNPRENVEKQKPSKKYQQKPLTVGFDSSKGV
jgi:hypothetical protein